MAGSDIKTYRGNCHCGAIVFEAEMAEIKAAKACNCSICHKKGYLWLYPEGERLRFVKGSDDSMTGYTFGSGKIKHQFCPTCATPLMARNDDAPPGKRLAHAIQGLNTWDLKIEPFNGAEIGAPYEHPEFKGHLPEAATVEGSSTTLYTGGCHCGRVGVAVASEWPLDKRYEGRTIECNCSICERNAYRWMYPPRQAVTLAGEEADIGRYPFGRRKFDKTFCRVCGVNVSNDRGPEAVAGDWPEANHPVNIRVLRGVDLERLPAVEKYDGWNKLPPAYENP
ncbi:hypothetical protein CP532_3256 [Ophiocordyceps camponoti-leonardi (nom. inval.)]|nr:hypothetical protein CP532_3256 [Ophiocordyceps camponoti-leonardi (nom. inval.)]